MAILREETHRAGGQTIGGKMIQNYIYGAQVTALPCSRAALMPPVARLFERATATRSPPPLPFCAPSAPCSPLQAVLLCYDITNYDVSARTGQRVPLFCASGLGGGQALLLHRASSGVGMDPGSCRGAIGVCAELPQP